MQRVVTSIVVFAVVTLLFPLLTHAHTLTATDAEGEPGDLVEIQILLDTDVDADGYQVGVCHNADELSLEDAVLGATSATVNGGGEPGFFGINTEPEGGDGVTLGVIVDLTQTNVLPAGDDAEILDITYEIIAEFEDDEAACPDDALSSLLEFCDTLGSPAVPNAVIVDNVDETPDFEDGTVTICPPAPYCIELTCEGGLTDATIDWDICSDFDYFLIHRDGEFLEMLDAEDRSFFDEELEAGTYYYNIVGVAFPEITEPAIIVSELCSVDVIPLILNEVDPFSPTSGPYAGGTLVTLSGMGFEGGTDFNVTFGGIDATDIMIVDDMTATCVTPEFTTIGPVAVAVSHSNGDADAAEDFLYGFIRGDFNEDGAVSIADPIVLLEYLFTAGDEPGCLDACDANDDALLDVADPIYVLQYLFNLEPVPPEPFDAAGLDPTTGDPYGCLDVAPE